LIAVVTLVAALARLLIELEPGVAGRALRIDGARPGLGGIFAFRCCVGHPFRV
jgi:hypothetical protein